MLLISRDVFKMDCRWAYSLDTQTLMIRKNKRKRGNGLIFLALKHYILSPNVHFKPEHKSWGAVEIDWG